MRMDSDTISARSHGDRRVERDEFGYLIDPEQWDEDIAAAIAEEEGITLTNDHWAVLQFMRQYLDRHGIAADARFAYAYLARRRGQPLDFARNHYFHLFPYGHVKQACKIAGMRQPRSWSAG
jgi:tRNA 2-thiouridine synthesizing protein E